MSLEHLSIPRIQPLPCLPGCQALPCGVDWLQAGLFFLSGIFREPPLPGLVVYGWQGQYQHLPQSAREQWLANSPAPAGNQNYLTRKHKFIQKPLPVEIRTLVAPADLPLQSLELQIFQLFPVHGFYLWRLVFRFPWWSQITSLDTKLPPTFLTLNYQFLFLNAPYPSPLKIIQSLAHP